jgi:hypothetical protein
MAKICKERKRKENSVEDLPGTPLYENAGQNSGVGSSLGAQYR